MAVFDPAIFDDEIFQTVDPPTIFDPGYLPGGQRMDATTPGFYNANPPPTVVASSQAVTWSQISTPARFQMKDLRDEEVFTLPPLGTGLLPAIDQSADEVWKSVYLGGVQ